MTKSAKPFALHDRLNLRQNQVSPMVNFFKLFSADFATPFLPCVPHFSWEPGMPYMYGKPTKLQFFSILGGP
ncbi:MAG: hypothetical protein MJA83_09125, partial [Gammaproteobacteria bacterium]|nr:hypothetical protein [Gammaproteobacteria bacterium]